jgi:hypothetical protein
MNPIKFIIDYFKRLSIPKKQELLEYYPKYLLAHKNPINKILHIFGNILTLIFIAAIILLSKVSLFFLPLIILTPFVVYVGAWPGHFWFEKNKPATFKVNPLLTKTCDWIMMSQILTGKLKLDTRNECTKF